MLASIRLGLRRRARRPGRLGALLAGAALRVVPETRGDITVSVWGRKMRLPAEHHLPYIVGTNPFWSMSLVHCVDALKTGAPVNVIDVGGNVGDTPILLESCLPGRCRFLCIEPSTEWLPYLRENTRDLPVEVMSCFVGEGQRLEMNPSGEGSAGSRQSAAGVQSVRLDEICAGKDVDLIKIDTDGFDFPILRSAEATILEKHPAIFFEWAPELWSQQGEDPEAVFEWLRQMGYQDVCLFADGGFLYCRAATGQRATFRSLVAAAQSRRNIDRLYWDVFAAPEEVCEAAMNKNTEALAVLTARVPAWNRLQPTYWV